jgi:polar amino acid transport system substrate-binding protein
MNIIFIVFLCLFFGISPLHAIGPALTVGIDSFTPPFVMQSANNKLYGFDIEMMNNLCEIMQRTCQFKMMRFEQLIPSVANKTVNVALSSITITNERAKMVRFSLPYLLSYSRFIKKNDAQTQPFTLDLLNNKKIGIEEGSVFSDEVTMMGVKNPTIKIYPKIDDLLLGLSQGDIDYALVDNPTGNYWVSNSAGKFAAVGDPLMYGNGFGIAVNPDDPELLTRLNRALLQYESGEAYKANYNRYFPPM